MTRRIERLRERVQEVENRIQTIYYENMFKWNVFRSSLHKCKQVEKLLWQRKRLLDDMFVATDEEVERMGQVNNRLSDLTDMLYARTEELYHKMMVATYNPAFDNDVDVEGTLKFEMNDDDSILPMNNDDYYGSDFALAFKVIECLYTHKFLSEDIEFCYCYCSPSNYKADMSREELGIPDNRNDSVTWYEVCQPAADRLNNLCICHAIYDLNMNKPYSIPDILRMNDFTIEVAVKHQHFARQ